MSSEEMGLLETILGCNQVGYAYLYSNQEGKNEEYVFDMTPEHIAGFLCKHIKDFHQIILTDMLDALVLDTLCGLIHNCSDQDLYKEIMEILPFLQSGEKKMKEVPMLPRILLDEYCMMVEEAVMQMEMR